ncbi:MAG: AAA family ATPase, partial [Alphaproteobacteria bacterium]|nr:AAA family ATPase [Alphaproteobacteria bacterium]
MDIAAWLKSLGLERYAQAFADNEIDAAVLPGLTGDDLKEMGVAAVGHRRKLLDAITALRNSAPIAAVVAPTPAAGAERRHLTVMFVDLVGSTQMSTTLDPEDMRAVIIAYQNAVAAEISRVDGNVAKYMGDGVLAYFGWPKAHENESERAVRAGLAIATAVARLKAPTGQALSARVGIATGMVVVGDLIGEGAAQEQAVVGDTPNLAARIQSIAAPGQVAIADATQRLIAGMFEVEPLGEHELKGIAGRTKAFAVMAERALESRFAARVGAGLSALVGRDQELALLSQRWRQANNGEGQLVLLTGEAGMGKSRLTEALVDVVAAEPHHRIRFQCSPYHTDSALFPAIQYLTHAAGIVSNDGPGQRLQKLADLLSQHTTAPQEDIALIASLLSINVSDRFGSLNLSPQQHRFRTLQAIVNHVVALSKSKPVLFLLEDAHWIDPTTRDLIDQSIADFATARVLLLITTRPGPAHSFAGRAVLTQLVLSRLTRDDVAGIARRAGGGKQLPAALIDEIAAKSDGVPLYVEEIA